MAWMARECQQNLERQFHSPVLRPRVEGDGWANWSGLATLLAAVEELVKNHLSGLLSL